MTLDAKNTDGMKYELSKIKPSDMKGVALKLAGDLPTLSLVWLLVKRHKVFILSVGNVVLLLNFIFPAWTTFLSSVL